MTKRKILTIITAGLLAAAVIENGTFSSRQHYDRALS